MSNNENTENKEITLYVAQEWLDNSTKISAENLNKVEEGLATLSGQTQRYVTEWADEWSTFKETEFAGISSNVYDNSCNIETAFNTLSGHYARLETLDAAVAGINTPVQTVSATVNALTNTWVETNQTSHFDSVPKDRHLVRLDISLYTDGYAPASEEVANTILNKKRIPLWSISSIPESYERFCGTGPGTVNIFSGTDLWSSLLTEQPGAAWENITSDEEESLLGNPIMALDNKLTFAVYNPRGNGLENSGKFVANNYDADIDYILIFYSPKNNKYYFANLNNLGASYDLRYYVTSMPPIDSLGTISNSYVGGDEQKYLCIDQHYVNCENIKLPANDLNLYYVAFMTKTSHIEEVGVPASDYFYFLGDLYPATLTHPYIFRMQGNSGNFYEGFPILSAGTYYLDTCGIDQDLHDFWYKIGNSDQGPYSNTEGLMPDLTGWANNFSNPRFIYKFTYPTGTSNAYKVLDLCPKHTDDAIKQIAKNTLNDLISFGSGDPTSGTNGMFYFKTNNAD